MIAERQTTSYRGLRARPLLPTILGVWLGVWLGVRGGSAVHLRCAVLVLAFAVGCGGKHAAVTRADAPAAPRTPAEQILALLPQGAQVVVEIDLARLRDNPVVGPVIGRLLADGVDLPGGVAASPLRSADLMVLAAYGVGTAQAATVTVLVAKAEIPGTIRLAGGFYALGPEDWIAQLEARAAIAAGQAPLHAPPDLLALRDHAMPPGAPGAALRITARLPFDARVALARQTGLESAPGQLSIWADVVEDFAMIVDADSTDPGEKASKKSLARLQVLVRGALAALAGDPTARALGLPGSLANARLVTRGTWVRAIIAIGPAHLQRVVERALAFLPAERPPP
jgi:hypothetical protein